MKIITQIIGMGLVIVLLLSLANTSFAEEKKEGKAASIINEVEGEVSAVSKYGIAVVLLRDLGKGTETEIFLPFEKEKIKIIHKRNIEEIQAGDIVKVEYEIISEQTKEDESSRFNAKTITFLKPAQKNPLPPETAAKEDESEGEALPLKGIK